MDVLRRMYPGAQKQTPLIRVLCASPTQNRPGEKMKTLPLLAALPLLMAGASMPATAQQDASASCAQWLDHEVSKLNSSETIDICAETAGKPVVLVNTASY